MVSSGLVLVAAVALTATTLAPQTVDAHGYIATPKSEFKAGTSQPSSWVAEFKSPWGGSKWTAADYAKTAPGKGFKDLRSFLESHGPACGNTNPNASPKPIPSDKKVKFSREIVHPGPCELWLDNTRVWSHNDCEAKFGKSIPTWSIDFSSCKGSCMLRFYWLGLQDQGARWQSYKNCIPLKNSSTKARSIDSEDDGDEIGADADADASADATTDTDADVDADVGPESRAMNGTETGVKCKTKAKRA